MKQAQVYIIILNWNGYKDTLDCIKSLKKINYSNYKIVVVDNGSTNESVSVIKTKYPELKLIETRKNLGFSGGVNVGIKYAMDNDTDYILLLNNDTYVKEDFLNKLIDVGNSDKRIGILSSLIYYINSDVIWSSIGIKNFTSIDYPYIDKYYKKKYVESKTVYEEGDVVTGCSMLIKKDVINKIGYLNDNFFLYAEDTEYCVRATNADFKVVLVKSSSVWHKISQSSGGEGNTRKDYYNNRNMLLFARKHIKSEEKLKFYTFFLLGRLNDMIIHIKHKKFSKNIAIIKGLYDGMLGKNGYNSRV